MIAILVSACGHVGRTSDDRRAADPPASSATHTGSASDCTTDQVLATWSPARLAAQLVVVPVQETDVTAIAPSVAAGVGGIILFGSSAPADLGRQIASTEAGAPGGINPLVMTDEEGGGVQRLANLVGNLPWPRTMAQTMTTAQVEALATTTADTMRSNGVTMDLAPDLDLASGPGPDATHTDGPRSFSSVPSTATAYGLAFARGLLAGGVVPVVKHFPGEGSASANTDDAPATTPPLDRLESADLLPFEAAIDAKMPALMVGNATIPGLTNGPASLSDAAFRFLRQNLGFSGVVMTDSLSANAITAAGYSLDRAAAAAIEAGADMVLFNSDAPNADAQSVTSAIVGAATGGALPAPQLRASVARVLALKGVSLCPT